MRLPEHNPYAATPFTRYQLEDWITRNKPTAIEMTDRQYAHFAGIMRGILREYRGIPIVFTDAPTQTDTNGGTYSGV